MRKQKLTTRLLILVAALLFFIMCLAPFAHAAEVPDTWTEQQVKAHRVAELAREMGLAEDDPIIVRAQELWHAGGEPMARTDASVPPLYTDEDATMIAKVLWEEGRGIPSTTEKACNVWCILNRVDAGYGTIAQTITAPHQFAYRTTTPVWDELLSISYDVLSRWEREKNGETDVGRVLPSDYLWYSGDGKHNWFRNKYRGGDRWGYSLASPYID